MEETVLVILNPDIKWELMNVPEFDSYKFKYGSAYGIGYYSKPFSRSRKNSDRDDCWRAWNSILQDVSKGNATICEEWKEYYCFRDWYKAHDYQIEGDRIFLTTKVFSDDFYYSPETCVFASRKITQFIIPEVYGNPRYDENGVELPLGITYRRDNPKWSGWYVISSTDMKTGEKITNSFKTKEEAMKRLKEAKTEGAKILADEYKPYITEKFYNYLKYEYEWKARYRSEINNDKTE